MDRSVSREASTTDATIARFGLTATHASGATVFTTQGEVIDLTGALGTALLGYGEPSIKAAITRQTERLIHAPWHLPTDVKTDLLERLAAHFPEGTRFLPCVSGTDAVEAALKTVRSSNPRGIVLAFTNAYHGKSLAALDVTYSPRLRNLVPPSVTNAPRLPYPIDRGMGPAESLRSVRASVALTGEILDALSDAGEEVMAIFVEPVQGTYMTAPDRVFLQQLRSLTADRGIALVVDEVFSALRTGSFFAFEESGITPDLTIFGKALGGGLPISFVAGDAERLARLAPGAHSGTFQANPLAAAAALATMNIVEAPSFHLEVMQIRKTLQDAFSDLARIHGWQLTGRGLMFGIDLNASGGRAGVGRRVQDALRRHGVFVLEVADRLRLSPPVCISPTEISRVQRAFEAAMEEGF